MRLYPNVSHRIVTIRVASEINSQLLSLVFLLQLNLYSGWEAPALTRLTAYEHLIRLPSTTLPHNLLCGLAEILETG